MALHTVVGAGAVGSGIALRLAEAGHDVRVITRSGKGPSHLNLELVAADASDSVKLTELGRGAHALYNCANPPYDKWTKIWPPLAASFITAAEATSARLVTMSNLYGFAPTTAPMKATDVLAPTTRKGRIRTDMWHDSLQAHNEGRIQATEARASDFFGPGLGETSHLGDQVIRRVLGGKNVYMVGRTDMIHSMSYIGDVAATLFALGTDDSALGRAWHVPTLPAVTSTDRINQLADAAKVDRVKVKRVPTFLLRATGLFVPIIREVVEMLYQFEAPFEIDATDTTTAFGLEPTPLEEQLRATIASCRAEKP